VDPGQLNSYPFIMKYYAKRMLLLVAMPLLAWATAQGQQIKIGIITDYDKAPNFELIINSMIREMDQTAGATKKVVLGSTVYGISSAEQAQNAYASVSAQSNLVITIGSITAKALSAQPNLPKPVLALGVIDPLLQDIAYKNGTSGKQNFTYIWQTKDLDKEIEVFDSFHDFENLVVFVDEKGASTINPLKGAALIDSMASRYNASLTIVPLGNNIAGVMDQIPANVDAAYFTVLLSQEEAQLKQLINELNEQQIPTFTGNARLIELGVLASLTNENNLQQVIRKAAITVDEIIAGGNLASMPVRLDTKENLYLNLETARSIEFAIPFEVLFTATLIGDNAGNVKTYSFEEIAEKSIKANLNIQISYQDIELSQADLKLVKANVLPALDAGLTGSRINEERASAAFNTAEQTLSADLTLTQVIYSEQAIAGIKITQYLLKAQEYNTEAEVLNVLLDTYTAYLNILSAKTNVLIQQENLQNTKKNKELAEIRVNVGASNNADLYRWESELALANQAVVEAQAGLMQVKLQLRNLLANTLETEFDVADVSLDDAWFASLNQTAIADMVRTPKSLQAVADFLVAESQASNPNKRALLENVNAANRQLTQNKRLLYVPTIALQAQTAQVLGRAGAGSTIDAQAQALGITELQNNSWSVGASLTLPIFSGFARRADVQRAQVSVNQLSNSQTLLDQNLELAVRANIFSLLSASTNIQFSNEAATSARQNFNLVQENYKQGLVTITQVIDAQEAALQAQLGAAISVYEYLQAFLQLEFNVGGFTMLMPENERQDFNSRLQEYLNNQN